MSYEGANGGYASSPISLLVVGPSSPLARLSLLVWAGAPFSCHGSCWVSLVRGLVTRGWRPASQTQHSCPGGDQEVIQSCPVLLSLVTVVWEPSASLLAATPPGRWIGNVTAFRVWLELGFGLNSARLAWNLFLLLEISWKSL